MAKYTLYGLQFASDLRFRAPLPPATGPVSFTVTQGPEAPGGEWCAGETVYESPHRDGEGRPVVTLYRGECGDRLHFPRAADYFLTPDRIHVRPLPHGDPTLSEIYLLGTVLAWCREAAGVPVLHAAAVKTEAGTVAFLASNQGGKSSLAASFVRAGEALHTDDLLAVELDAGGWIGHSGYPRMRLWPDQAEHFAGSTAGLESVTAETGKLLVPVERLGGTFHAGPLPLRALYLPERRTDPASGPEIRIAPASPRQGLIELARHSFLARMAEAAGLQPERLAFLARLASQVPIRTLSYPSGVELLPRVVEAIRADLEGLHPQPGC